MRLNQLFSRLSMLLASGGDSIEAPIRDTADFPILEIVLFTLMVISIIAIMVIEGVQIDKAIAAKETKNKTPKALSVAKYVLLAVALVALIILFAKSKNN